MSHGNYISQDFKILLYALCFIALSILGLPILLFHLSRHLTVEVCPQVIALPV